MISVTIDSPNLDIGALLIDRITDELFTGPDTSAINSCGAEASSMKAGRQLGFLGCVAGLGRLLPGNWAWHRLCRPKIPLYYPGNITIWVICTVCIKRGEKRVAQARRIRCFPPTRGVAPCALKSMSAPILQAAEALLTLSFRLDLTIYRRYNPRT